MFNKVWFKFPERVSLKTLVLRTPCFGSSYPQVVRVPPVKNHWHRRILTISYVFLCCVKRILHKSRLKSYSLGHVDRCLTQKWIFETCGNTATDLLMLLFTQYITIRGLPLSAVSLSRCIACCNWI